MAVHSAIARNFAEASENKIHSDDIARRFGFTGALVPGVTVFGHLAWPLTQRFGERWLRGSWAGPHRSPPTGGPGPAVPASLPGRSSCSSSPVLSPS